MSQQPEIKVIQDFQDVKHFFFEKQGRDMDGETIPDYNSLVEMAKVWVSAEALNVPSDNAVNGVAIITHSIPANTMLVLTKLKVGSDGEQTISIAFGTALDGSQVDIDHDYLNGKQMWEEFSDGKSPVLAVHNTTNSAVNLFIYAKTGTIMGVVNNPVAGARNYMAVIGGFTL